MPLLRAFVCLALVASPAWAQVSRSDAVGAKADQVPPKPFTEPLMAKADFHVHIKADLTLDEALRRSSADGIYYGIVINGGLSFPISTDAGLEAFLAGMRGKPAFVAFQAEGREWVRLFSNADAREVRLRLHRRHDVDRRQRQADAALDGRTRSGPSRDPQAFMDTLVDAGRRASSRTSRSTSTSTRRSSPPCLQADYDRLWTPARMKAIVDGLAANGIAMEINNRYRIPSAAFIRLAKQAGVKFACGTNNTGAADLGRNEYCIEMIRECGLQPGHFWMPPADGRKAVQRKPLLK